MSTLIIIVLLVFLLLAALQDLKSYRIPNILVISGAVSGVLLNTFVSPELGALGGLNSLAGFCLGLVLLLPMYLIRAMSAGDVKLMAMVGAFLGPQAIVIALLYILLTGGILSACFVWHRGVLQKTLSDTWIIISKLAGRLLKLNFKSSPESTSSSSERRMQETNIRFPFGVAIAVGTAIYLAFNP